MSCMILDQEGINVLTQATGAMLRMNKKYKASYPLNSETVELLGKYAEDPHNLYRALYIANCKAFNGRYDESNRNIPKYKPVRPWDPDRLNPAEMQKACGVFGCYMYQLAEDPVYDSPVYRAFYDIYKLLTMVYVSKVTDWHGNPRK